tara:strand:+ start:631 stop:846 length:216 start_codon:yes stop_codon:yes gene_type:complete
MEKLKELLKKLNPRVAMVGGAIVLTTSLGTCHFVGGDEGASEEAPVEAPVEEVAEPKPAAPAEAPEEDSKE